MSTISMLSFFIPSAIKAGYQNHVMRKNLMQLPTMINGTLFLSLLEAIPTGAKVIIMGDVQQLTPIGNCQVFADILDSNVLPVQLNIPIITEDDFLNMIGE